MASIEYLLAGDLVHIKKFSKDASSRIHYIGYALPGTADSSPLWFIKQCIYDGAGFQTDELFEERMPRGEPVREIHEEPSAGNERALHLPQRAERLGKVADGRKGKHGIEGFARELRSRFRVGFHETHVVDSVHARAFPGDPETAER